MQLHEEMEKSYREKFQKQELEMEEFRTTCNKLKHELFFLKSEYEHEQTESRQILAEMKLQHDAEVSTLDISHVNESMWWTVWKTSICTGIGQSGVYWDKSYFSFSWLKTQTVGIHQDYLIKAVLWATNSSWLEQKIKKNITDYQLKNNILEPWKLALYCIGMLS